MCMLTLALYMPVQRKIKCWSNKIYMALYWPNTVVRSTKFQLPQPIYIYFFFLGNINFLELTKFIWAIFSANQNFVGSINYFFFCENFCFNWIRHWTIFYSLEYHRHRTNYKKFTIVLIPVEVITLSLTYSAYFYRFPKPRKYLFILFRLNARIHGNLITSFVFQQKWVGVRSTLQLLNNIGCLTARVEFP